MKTKTKILTKLLAVFAVIFLCLGIATISLGGASSAIAAETTATTTVKDGGFTGNLFNLYSSTVNWGNKNNANQICTYEKRYDADNGDNFYVKLDKTNSNGSGISLLGEIKDSSGNSITSLIWHDDNNANYWIAGKTYCVSFDYKITKSESSQGKLSSYPMINSSVASVNGSKSTDGQDNWKTLTYQFTVDSEYVKDTSKSNSIRIVFEKFTYQDEILIKNIKVEMAGTPVEQGEQICDMSGLTYVNSSANHMTLTTTDDGAYDMVFKTSGVNGQFDANVAWCAGRTYEISFWLKTVETASTPTWVLWLRSYVNNTVYALDCGGGNNGVYYKSVVVQGKINEWTQYKFRFTPTSNATTGDNKINLIFTLTQNDEVQMKDFIVTMSTDGLKNVVPTLKSGRARTGENADTALTYNFTSDENGGVSDATYGKVNEIIFNSALSSNENRIIWNTDVKWLEGATYTVYFKVKTSESSAITMGVFIREKRYSQEQICGTGECLNSAVTEWKTVCKSFTTADFRKTVNMEQGTTAFSLILFNGKANDVLYYTDVKVYANLSDVTIKNGETTTTETVVTGSEYTLPTHTAVEGKTFIGWTVDNETLLNAGDKITVTGDTTVNAVLVDFSTQDGAWLRLDSENPGLRFKTNADKTAIETTLKTYYGEGATFTYGMRVTAVDASNNAIDGYMDIATTIWQKENKSFASAITGFDGNSQFCTATFTVTAYINVKISDTETVTVYAKSVTASGSIVEIANTAYNDRSGTNEDGYTQLIETDVNNSTLSGKYSKYTQDELAIIWNLSQLTAADNMSSAE